MEPKYKLGDVVDCGSCGRWGDVLLIRRIGKVHEYFIDPHPGAEGNYEWMWLMKDGEPFFVAGNWYYESDVSLYEIACKECNDTGEIVVCGFCEEGEYHTSCDDTFVKPCPCQVKK